MFFGLFGGGGSKFMNKMEEIGDGSAMADAAGEVIADTVKKKKEYTPDELALIETVRLEHIARQTQQEPYEKVVEAVAAIWKYCGEEKAPKVILCDSPIDCKKKAVADGYNTKGEKGDPKKLTEYWSIWYVGYNAMYDFGNRIGLDIDKSKLELFNNWVMCCPFVLFNTDVCYVSRKPHTLVFNEQQQLHNETAKSCEFNDGWGIWTLNGLSADEQLAKMDEEKRVAFTARRDAARARLGV